MCECVNVRERERVWVYVCVFVTNVLDKGGSLPPNPRPEADRWKQDNHANHSPQEYQRPETTHLGDIRAFIQVREGGRPQIGSPRPKGESPRGPEATGTLVRFKSPRCPRTTQRPAENPPLRGQLRTPEPTSICIRGRGRKVQHRGQGSGSPKHKPSHGHTLIQSTHSLTLTHPLVIHSETFFYH